MTKQSREQLLAFQRSRGLHLIEHGSAEFGLNIVAAREFVNLLASQDRPLLGIEIWRAVNGRYRLSGQEILVPLPGSAVLTQQDASDYFTSINAGPDDVFAIQFS